MLISEFVNGHLDGAGKRQDERDLHERVTQLVARIEDELRTAQTMARETRQKQQQLARLEHDLHSAAAVLLVGCGAMLALLFIGGGWAAGLELILIAWLIRERLGRR